MELMTKTITAVRSSEQKYSTDTDRWK